MSNTPRPPARRKSSGKPRRIRSATPSSLTSARSVAADETATFTLRNPEELVASIPYLLGFIPKSSIVALGLHEPSHALTVTARVDLPTTREESVQAGEALAVGLLRSGAGSVCLVVFRPTAGKCIEVDDGTVHASGLDSDPEEQQALLGPVVQTCTDAGLSVACVLELTGEHELGAGLGAALGDGPIPDLALASVVQGRQVLGDRAQIERRVAAVDGPATDLIHRALRGLAALELPTSDLADGLRRILDRAAEAATSGFCRATLGPEEVALVCLALRQIDVRDELLGDLCAMTDAPYDDLLAQICQSAPPNQVAPAATVLAAAAYMRGNGVLARCAIDRALEVERSYSLARLLQVALDNALHPSGLRLAFSEAVGASAGITEPEPARREPTL